MQEDQNDSSFSDPRKVECAVVGAGLAGLTASATLRRAGVSTVTIDGHDPGGRASTVERDGFRLNQGPHALYNAGLAMRELTALGLRPRGVTPRVEQTQILRNGSLHAMPLTVRSLATSKVLDRQGRTAALRVLPRLQRGRDRAARGLTVSEWLERRRVPGDLRAMIEMLIRLTTYSNSPDVMSAEAALAQFALGGNGVIYLDDGWSQLVDALSVDLSIVRREVTEVRRDGSKWVVLRADGEAIAVADSVIVASGGPATAARLVGRDPGWTESAGPECRAAVLDLGVAPAPRSPIVLSVDDPLYGSTHSPPARLAPEGHSLISAMRYLRPHEEHDRDITRSELGDHARRMGVEPATAIVDRYLHRMVTASGTPLADRRRPHGAELAADGLWAAGDWVAPDVPGGEHALLADAAVGSGAAAARAVARQRERTVAA
ncbi:MAG: FAD-dependent oxidoreductase [Actinomycetota bacterium]